MEKLQLIEKQIEDYKRKAKVKELKAMLTILSDYGRDIKLLDYLLTDDKINKQIIMKHSKKMKTFLQSLTYLEQWAKNEQIYSNKMGFLDSKMLKIMLMKIFLLYPNASSVHFIIEKFFLTFTTWNWPMPVQLEMIGGNHKSNDDIMNWSPGREWFQKQLLAPNDLRKRMRRVLTMPIIRPMFPEENLGQKINMLNAQVIQWKMRKALTQIWEVNDNTSALFDLIKPINFFQMYENFIAIKCVGNKFIIEMFCDFVGKRIGHELLRFNEEFLGDFVEFLHLFPQILNNQNEENAQRFTSFNLNKIFKFWYFLKSASRHEKIWHVGIQFKTNAKSREFQIVKNKFEQFLKKDFDVGIVNDFQKFCFYNVELHSEIL